MKDILQAYEEYFFSHENLLQYKITYLAISPTFTLISLNHTWWGIALTNQGDTHCNENENKNFFKHFKQPTVKWILQNKHLTPYHNSILGALANAIFQQWVKENPTSMKYEDLLDDYLQHSSSILLFGYFKNFVSLLEKLPVEWYVIEKNLNVVPPTHLQRAIAFDDDRWKKLAQRSQLNIITGSTILNQTLTNILPHVPASSTNILTGPSAGGIIPVLRNYPIHVIAGSFIHSSRLAKKIISLGGSAHTLFQLKALKKVYIKLQ
jgi:uncharacterized protein (DUF4213/DUF364 family)